VPYDGKFPADWPYDKPGYDWLADPYGAAVNPIFWKIHGYVDHMIDLWLAANGFQSIKEDCGKTPACYQWKGKVTGATPTWLDEPKLVAGGGRKGLQATPRLDERTRAFNQQRMRKQWLGVIGGPPSAGQPKGPPRAGRPQPPSSDPFVQAVEQACGKRP